MVEWIPTSKLILFPQLFWGTVALLHSDYEVHFSQAVQLLSKLVDRFNFSDRAVHNIFLASIPKAWYVQGIKKGMGRRGKGIETE
jgi:hypothetical protein